MALNRILEWVERFSILLAKLVETLVTVALIMLFVLIVSEVIARGYLNMTIAWMMEAVGFLLAFITFLGISVHVYEKKLLSLEFLRERIFRTERAITLFSIFTWCILVAYAYVLVTEGLVFAERGIARFTPSRRFELYHVRLIVPVGGVLVLVQGLMNIVKDLAKLARVVVESGPQPDEKIADDDGMLPEG